MWVEYLILEVEVTFDWTNYIMRNFIIVLFVIYFYGSEIEEHKMGRNSGTHHYVILQG